MVRSLLRIGACMFTDIFQKYKHRMDKLNDMINTKIQSCDENE